jgi:hypothetical protein
MAQELTHRDRYATQDLDELQRGSESPITLETLEGASLPTHGERREIPVPHPGERPGAVRADQAVAEADREEDDEPARSG